MNTFTKKKRGRPRGTTEQGAAKRQELYDTALALFARKGYEATTLRAIAEEAGVSVGLLYRYFPSKRAVVLAQYETLSSEYATRAAALPEGTWAARALFCLHTSLEVLARERSALVALAPGMVGDADTGLFAKETSASRLRVQSVFEEAVRGAVDAPRDADDAARVGRLLYLAHLAVILFWLLDKSPKQAATARLLAVFENLGPLAALAMSFPPALAVIRSLDELVREGIFGEGQTRPQKKGRT